MPSNAPTNGQTAEARPEPTNGPAVAEVPRITLTADEAAHALGIGTRLLWERTNQSEIPHFRVGRRTLYPVDELRAWASEQAASGNRRA